MPQQTATNYTKATPKSQFTVQTRRVFRPRDCAIYSLLTVVLAYELFRFGSRWLEMDGWSLHPVLLSIATVLIARKLFEFSVHWFLMPTMIDPVHVEPEPGLRVAAVTTFVPGGEPLEMLRHTLMAMAAMRYPHDTWLLDEGDDPAVRALCLELGVQHYSRWNKPRFQTEKGTYRSRTKYGNYNAWLADYGYDNYDVLAAFDCDHVPNEHFLTESLGYFRDQKVGYVQSADAHYNKTASLVAYAGTEMAYPRAGTSQRIYYGLGHPYVIGSHNLHRMNALKSVGGFAAHDADDMLITNQYRARRWRGIYVPKIIARGLAPVTWDKFLIQWRRWIRSIADLKIGGHRYLDQPLPWGSRIVTVLIGLTLLEGLTTPVSLLVLMYILVTGAAVSSTPMTLLGIVAEFMLVFLVLDFYRQRFLLDFKNEFGLYIRSAFARGLRWPVVVRGVFEAITGWEGEYVLTKKTNDKPRLLLLKYHAPSLVVLLAAMLIGLFQESPYWLAYASAVNYLVVFGGFIAYDVFRTHPEPFDAKILREQWSASSGDAFDEANTEGFVDAGGFKFLQAQEPLPDGHTVALTNANAHS